MTVLFAHDFSGSTSGATEYHTVARQLLESLPNETKFVLWDDKFEFVDRAKIINVINSHQGRGGTYPTQIVKACEQINFSGELIILTDGDVSNVDEADQLIQQLGMNFTKVTVHIVNRNPNISVCAPFIRQCPHEIMLHKNAEVQKLAQVTDEDRKVIDIMQTVITEDHFNQIYDTLHAVIQAATIGTNGDPTLRDKVILMRERIVKNKAKVVPKSLNEFESKILEKNIDEAVNIMKDMYKEYYGEDDITSFEGKMSRLINMCSGRLRNQFDLGVIASQRAATAQNADAAGAEVLTEEQANNQNLKQLLMCPITLGEASDLVLLIKAPDTPLLGLLDKYQVEECINNPLNAFKFPDFIKAIADHLDVYISLEAYKESFNADMPLTNSPITGSALCGALAFGENNEYAKVTDYTLAVLLAGGKLMGNINLWFAVIYFIIRGNPKLQKSLLPEEDSVIETKSVYTIEVIQNVHSHAERLGEMLPLFQKHMTWRLLNRKTFASLSGLSQFVVTKMHIAPAIWHILHSCLLNPSTQADSLRLHISHVDRFLDLLNLVNYSVDTRVLKHSLRLKAMLQLLGATKEQSSGCSSFETLGLYVKALSQKAEVINHENIRDEIKEKEYPVHLVLLDGAASEEQNTEVLKKLPYAARSLSVKEITGLFAMVNPQKSASDIKLDYNWVAPELVPVQAQWTVSTYTTEEQLRISSLRVPICAKTARPFAIVNNDAWQVAAEKCFGPLDGVIHTTRWFGQFIAKYKFYPTQEEFLVYLWNRVVKYGSKQKQALPTSVMNTLRTDFADHKELMDTITAEEFAQRWNDSLSLEKRQQIERE
ncbi:Conserved_hypothetical protein [Hexamita inflata]|uniref:Uncharacterized protein n=1 Tax=Hexamita inflata TaxID=28002 RepID=A0AA86N6J2_9EUKA|nr:Conserved hypothetical protein [Hexamita inflata]